MNKTFGYSVCAEVVRSSVCVCVCVCVRRVSERFARVYHNITVLYIISCTDSWRHEVRTMCQRARQSGWLKESQVYKRIKANWEKYVHYVAVVVSYARTYDYRLTLCMCVQKHLAIRTRTCESGEHIQYCDVYLPAIHRCKSPKITKKVLSTEKCLKKKFDRVHYIILSWDSG